jgi:hypothetical protein
MRNSGLRGSDTILSNPNDDRAKTKTKTMLPAIGVNVVQLGNAQKIVRLVDYGSKSHWTI